MRTRLLIATITVLAALFAALLGTLLYTEAGLAAVATQLGRLQRYGIHIEGVSGTLAGPLRIARFELDHPRVQVLVHDIVIDAQLRGLLLQTIRARSVTARDALVVLREADLPRNDRPPRFLPRLLRIDARDVDLGHVRYVHMNGTAVEADRIRGRVTITGRRLSARGVRIEARDFDAAGDLRLRAARPLGLQAAATGHLHLPDRPQLELGAQVDGTVDRLSIKAQLQAPQRANVDALLTRPQDRWRIAGRVDADVFSLNPWLERAPFSLREVALNVVAEPDHIEVAGKLGIPEIAGADLSVAASGRYAQRTLHIAQSDIGLPGTPAVMHASGTVAFDGEAPTLDLAASWRALQWPLRQAPILASAAGDARLSGPLPYDFSVAAQIEGPRIPQTQGSARGVLSREHVSIASYALSTLGGSLSGEGSLQFAQPRAWTLSARAAGIDPAALRPELPGRVDLLAQATGRGIDRNARFTLTLSELGGVVRGERVRGRGALQREREGWRIRGLDAALGGARLTLDGKLSADGAARGDTIDARWSLNAPALDRVLPEAAGTVAFSGTARGQLSSPHVVAELLGTNLSYGAWSARRLSIDADIDAAGSAASRLVVQGTRLGRGEALLESLRLSGEGTAAEHRIDAALVGMRSPARPAPPRAEMQIAGHYVEQSWSATLTTTAVSTGDPAHEIRIVKPASLLASRERAALNGLCFVVGAGQLCAEGEWERGGAWQGTVSGYEIPLAMLLPPSAEAAEYAGRIEGRVHAFAPAGGPWQADAGMRIIDAAIVYHPKGAEPETLNLGTGGLAATATPERIDFSFGLQAFTDTFVYANARLLRNGSELMRMPLTGDLRARAADANILPLVFPEIDHAAGVLTANAVVSGTLALPEVNGRVELAQGEFDSYRVNLALRDLSLIAALNDRGLDFRGTGKAGTGMLNVDGRLDWRGREPHGNLHLSGRDLLVADLPEYRVVASPDLHFRIDGDQIGVSGDVTIPSARVQPVQLGGAVRASDDASYVGEHPAERAGRYVVRSEIRISMGDDVRVDAFGLQGRIEGGVATTLHTGETPIGRGELTVDEGRYEAYGQKLDINRGRLLFEASPLDDPGLDIEARREVETVTVGLNVRGTLQEPRLTFFSDPSMPQTQIVSYLLTGRSTNGTQNGDRMTLDSARSTLAFQGGGLIASQLGRRIGIEEVGVESTVDSAGESNTALVLGKFLSPRLFISYGISLTESINTLKLRYTVSDRWIFRTEAGENQSADLEYTIER